MLRYGCESRPSRPVPFAGSLRSSHWSGVSAAKGLGLAEHLSVAGLLDPAAERPFGDAQIAGHLGDGATAAHQRHCIVLKLPVVAATGSAAVHGCHCVLHSPARKTEESSGLYLIYSRRGANNDHVFRNRAPLFIARVDPERPCVLRATEQILMPETGLDLAAGFAPADVGPGET